MASCRAESLLDLSLPLLSFVLAATLLWLSVFAYLLLLLALARKRRLPSPPGTPSDLPDIAVVIPTLDERALILPKLRDVLRTDYPLDKLRVVVVDGGSTDGTVELVQEEIRNGAAIRLLHLEGATGKAVQMNHVLANVGEDILVVTDVDAELEPGCIRALTRALVADPCSALIGASVLPVAGYLEEQLHWSFLNLLWWLEGEVLRAATVSGVCYAIRSSALPPLARDAGAEDVHLALAAVSQGLASRICADARATELRVPRRARELVRFRRRRGRVYVRELSRSWSRAPLRLQLLRCIRIWHFLVAPWLAGTLLLGAVALTATSDWPIPAAAALAFGAPGLLVLRAAARRSGVPSSGWFFAAAAGRLFALTWLALLTLPRQRRHSQETPYDPLASRQARYSLPGPPLPGAAPVRGASIAVERVQSQVRVLSPP